MLFILRKEKMQKFHAVIKTWKEQGGIAHSMALRAVFASTFTH